ncbi:PH domain-containing protein [Leucobacter chromiiresistens]|uniref:Putative membrane protein n=1 Tax=Leucobacter chromiiresistens TaxID=1079994 RepID=A0A1H0Z7U5_9MICO|nr:PH domain-containing protein [Leucobacter chromiiresistens]SDQ23512.1 putative membrane protein [Leucobacter chromiiresistens]
MTVDPEVDAQLPGDSDADGWRRMHPLSPLLRGGLALIVIAGIIVANFRDHFVQFFFANNLENGDSSVDVSGDRDLVDVYEFLVAEGLLLAVLGGILLVLLLIVLFSWLAWRFATYRITDTAVEVRGGVVFRSHRRAPLERIQSVNLQRSLLARALGLTKIEVVTAGQGGKVELSFLGHRDAKTVREQILQVSGSRRRGGEPRSVAGVAGAAPVGLDGSVYTTASDGLTARAQDFVDSDVDPRALEAQTLVRVPVGRLAASIALSWESVVLVVMIIGIVIGGAVLEAFLIFGVVPLLIVMAGVMFGQFNKGFNFTLSRTDDAVRTGSGLTSTITESIPFGRIHAVEARQPLLWRPLGWWKVRITTAGHSVAQGGQNATQNVVLPVGREHDVLRVIETLLPGTGDEADEIETLRDGLIGPAEGYVRGGRRSGAVLLWGRRRAGLALADTGGDDATLRIRRGVLTRSLSIMPIVRAQSIQLRRPLVHRMLGLASISAHTVLGPVRMEMRGLELGTAREVFDALAAQVLRVQGAEAQRILDARTAAPGAQPTAGAAGAAGADPSASDDRVPGA